MFTLKDAQLANVCIMHMPVWTFQSMMEI